MEIEYGIYQHIASKFNIDESKLKNDIDIDVEDINNENYTFYAQYYAYRLFRHGVFYSENILVTSFNIEPVDLFTEKHLEKIKRVTDLLIEDCTKNCSNHSVLLAGAFLELIYMYHISLNSNTYKSTLSEKFIKQVRETYEKKVLIRWVKENTPIIESYYEKIAIDNVLNISIIYPSFLERILILNNVLKFEKEEVKKWSCHLLTKNKLMFDYYEVLSKNKSLIKDPDISAIFNKYVQSKNLFEIDDLKLIGKMQNKSMLEDNKSIISLVINGLIDEYNNFIEQDDSLIMTVHQIDQLKKKIETVKKYFNHSVEYKDKLSCLIQNLLSFKRYKLKKHDSEKDKDFFSFSINIDKEHVEYAKNKIKNNIFNIYRFFMIDIKTIIESSITDLEKGSLTYHTNQVEISENHYRRVDANQGIPKIIDDMGAYFANKPTNADEKKYNFFKGKYYKTFRSKVVQSFEINLLVMHYAVDYRLLLSEAKKTVINMVKTNLNSSLLDNEKVLSIRLLKIIETLIHELTDEDNMKKALVVLFNNETYKERQGDVYLLYIILFGNDGFKVRHDLVHGNKIETNYKKVVILLIAALVAVSNLRFSGKGKLNE